MKNLFKLALCGLAFVLAACGQGIDGPDQPQTGITYKSCADKIEITGEAQEVTITITADAAWTAQVSNSKLATLVEGESGEAGTYDIVLAFSENSSLYSRNVTLYAKVEGIAQKVTICKITQKSVSEKGTDANVNKNFTWPILEHYYLWNKELKEKGNPKWDQAYDDFLDSALQSIYPKNSMDGYMYTSSTGQQQWVFYSYIERTTPTTQSVTRAEKAMYQGFGASIYAITFDDNAKYIHLAVEFVYPDSPAAKAGLKRGHYIGKINGTTITDENYYKLALENFIYEVPVGTTCTLEVSEFDWNTLDLSTQTETISMTSATYFENPVLFHNVYTYTSTKDESHKTSIGYMIYNSFDAAFDDEITKVFDVFAEEQAEVGSLDYVILDLRYNGGGNVASCRYLSSLLAGADALDGAQPKVFMYSRYNDDRMAAGGYNKNDYTTYKHDDFDKDAAMAYNFPFKEIYVIGTSDTASSSEMLINALRGIGKKVTLVGGRTNGKNVGMEVMNTQNSGAIDGNHYIFAPITFQSYNCKGESDYDDGFVPDAGFDLEASYEGFPLTDWGTDFVSAMRDGQEVYYMPDFFSHALNAILEKEFPVTTSSVKRMSPRNNASLPKQMRRLDMPKVAREGDIFRKNAWVLAE